MITNYLKGYIRSLSAICRGKHLWNKWVFSLV